jgi:hypothetical protein
MAIPYLTTATLPYGSRVVTVSAVGYIANSFSTSESLQIIERKDTLGAPNGAIGIRQPITGSATLQLATASTAIPQSGDEFGASVTGTSITFFITERSLPEDQAGFKTVTVSFREKI